MNVDNHNLPQREVTPHKVHFLEDPIILKKNMGKGITSSEPRKPILKRKSLFSSPAQPKQKVPEQVEELTHRVRT